MWDPAKPQAPPVEFGRHYSAVRAVAWLPDGRVVSGGRDRRVRVWDPAKPEAGSAERLVCDRDVTGGGIDVEFFGEKARMMGGAAALAAQTGAALMPVILWFEGDHWGVHVHEEIPVPAEGDRKQQAMMMMMMMMMMQDVARLFEAGIRAHPQDWHMLQRVFVADLDPERLRRAAGS